MNSFPEVSDAEAEKLLRLMTEADGGQPFMTHKAAATLGAFIIAELGKIAQQSEEAGNVKQEWATPLKIGKIYGVDRVTMAKHLAAWASAGKVQMRQIFDEVTRAYGNRLYSLADVDKLMKATAAEGQTRGTKSKKGAA